MSRTSGHTTQRSRQPPPTANQASEEQLRIASRIGESHNIPSDIKRKIQQVTAIVPNKSEDEICIMLHDNNFDPEAAISALLDNDSSDVKNEWTTKRSKNKKKVTQPSTGKTPAVDTIIAPGDSHSSAEREGSRSFGGTSKAASKSTRENYGGSVSVERVDREQRSGKSYTRSTSRGFRGSSGDRGRLRRRRGGSYRGFSSRDHDRGRSGGGGSENISNHLPSSQSSVPSTEGTWDDEPTFSSNQNDDSLLITSNSAEANWDQDEHHTITSAPSVPNNEQVSSAPSLSVFPDAMVPPLATEGEENRVSSSSPLINTTIPPSQQQTTVLDNRLIQQLMGQDMSTAIPVSSSSSSQLRVKFSDDLPTTQSSSSHKLKSSKMRKAMRSEIPSDPVQMPRAMGSLEVQFGNLGIDFIGMNGGSNEADDVHAMAQVMSQHQEMDDGDMDEVSFPQHLNQLPSSGMDQLTHTTSSNNPLLDSVTASAYTSQQHFVDDPSIISITSSAIMGTPSSREGFHHEEPLSSKIEPPPGLTHPSKLQQQANKDAAAKANELLQAPMSLSVASQQSEPRTSSSYGQASSDTGVLSQQQDNLLSTIATHQPPPLSTVVGGHKRNSSLQTEHHEVLSTESSSVLSGRSHDLAAHPQEHPILGKTSSGPPALDMARVVSSNMPISSSLPPSSRITSLPSTREASSAQMELPSSRIEPPSASQSVFSDKGMGQVSNGLLMTPMTTVSVTNPNMTAVSMGYSSTGSGTSRSGVSHSGPQSKHAVPPSMMYPAAAMMPQYPFVAYFPPSSDSMMATGMMRDHNTSNYPPADAKYGREISSPVGSTHGQQGQQTAQVQQQGLQQSQGVHHFMNAAIPYGNMFYPNSAMLYPTLGLPGFSPSMAPKPGTAGGSYPTGAVSSYQSMGAAGGFNMSGGYDEMSASVNHDYSKYMNPQTGKLSVGGSAVASTNSDMGASSFKHQQPPFDTTKNYGYNMPMGGSAGGYMGGFFPTMAMHPAAVHSAAIIPTPTDVNQPRQQVQKQHKPPYIGSVF